MLGKSLLQEIMPIFKSLRNTFYMGSGIGQQLAAYRVTYLHTNILCRWLENLLFWSRLKIKSVSRTYPRYTIAIIVNAITDGSGELCTHDPPHPPPPQARRNQRGLREGAAATTSLCFKFTIKKYLQRVSLPAYPLLYIYINLRDGLWRTGLGRVRAEETVGRYTHLALGTFSSDIRWRPIEDFQIMNIKHLCKCFAKISFVMIFSILKQLITHLFGSKELYLLIDLCRWLYLTYLFMPTLVYLPKQNGLLRWGCGFKP